MPEPFPPTAAQCARLRNDQRPATRHQITTVAVSPDFSAKRPLPQPVRTLANWWKGRDSNPRPRHYELAAPLKVAFKFNNLPRGARCDWHDEARPSTTDSRRIPARYACRPAGAREPLPRPTGICYMHIAYAPTLRKDSRPPPRKHPPMGAKAAGFGRGTQARLAPR